MSDKSAEQIAEEVAKQLVTLEFYEEGDAVFYDFFVGPAAKVSYRNPETAKAALARTREHLAEGILKAIEMALQENRS